MALSRLVTFSVSLLRNLDIEVDIFHDFMMQHFFKGVAINMLFGHL